MPSGWGLAGTLTRCRLLWARRKAIGSGDPVDGDIYPSVLLQFRRIALDLEAHRGLFVGTVTALGEQKELLAAQRAIVRVGGRHLAGRSDSGKSEQRQDQRDKKASR
jgi:hypothetical protein